MCGISGIFNLKESAGISVEILKNMMGSLHHRGPDESGIYIDDHIGLGHSRLSIIDLSSGSQPIHNEDKSLWIIFNGEIFNYPELRSSLMKKGHLFYTTSDTEVILHLFEELGPECLDELNGQFAFAIWDTNKRELFLARDRVGIRPLHYTVFNNRLIFASEIKSVFQYPGVIRELDPVSMDQIFTFWTTLFEKTAFKNIFELPPGHYLKVSGGNFIKKRYWDIPYCPVSDQLDLPVDDIRDRIQELLYDSIRIRLRADVPVGTYLSGGIDSSGITTLVSKNFNNAVKTFGIQFEEESFDEGIKQENMVSFLNADHERIRIKNSDIHEHFLDVLWHCEKPLLRTAPVPMYLISRLVQQNKYKVVLTGEGADEIFGGYNIFRENKVRRFWAKQPESEYRSLLLEKLYPYIFKNARSGKMLKYFFAKGLDKVSDPLFSHLIRWENTMRIKGFFSAALKSEIGTRDVFEELRSSIPDDFDNRDDFSKAQYLEMSIFMSNYLLSSQGDRMAAANSVEIRVPFLDHRLIEFMAKVPQKYKISGLKEKQILKKAFKGILPDNIVNQSKNPFRAPISQGLLSDFENLINKREPGFNELFDLNSMKFLLKKLKSSKFPNEVDNMALAGILSSYYVYRSFIPDFKQRQPHSISPSVYFDMRSSNN